MIDADKKKKNCAVESFDMWEAWIYCLSDEFIKAMKDLLSAIQVD